MSTKVCRFCSETIVATAIKCRYCKSMLNEHKQVLEAARPEHDVPATAQRQSSGAGAEAVAPLPRQALAVGLAPAQVFEGATSSLAPSAKEQPRASKACAHCGEEILAVAVKCKHCQTVLAVSSGAVVVAPNSVALARPDASSESSLGSTADRATTLLAYALYGFGMFLIVPACVSLVINYMKRNEALEPYASHHRWMISTSWSWFLWGLIGGVLTIVGVGYLIILGCWIWVLYRFSAGLLAAIDGRGIGEVSQRQRT